jgi:two-component system cell cycle sensor histidine kinase/response regulator CckA
VWPEPAALFKLVVSLPIKISRNLTVQMGALKANRERIIAGLLLLLLAAGLAIALSNRPAPWRDGIAQASYDSLHRFNGETTLQNVPVVIVYLDLASYKNHGLDPLKPWPRELHAQLLHRLAADGARAVVFDIIFSGPGPNAAEDETFARAICENRRVVLASEPNYDASHVTSDADVSTRSHSTTLPLDIFATNAAAVGMAVQAVDDDYALRRYVAGFSAGEPSLTWAAATWLRLPVTQTADAWRNANDNWIRYYGPPLSIPNVSYSEALDPAGVPQNFFRGKIVFVGARPWVEQFHERQDEFRSPFHSFTNKELFTPGVEVQATEMLNLLRSDSLRRLDARSEALWLLLTAAIFGVGLVWLRPIPATFAALVGGGLTFALASLGFNRGVWFPWLLVSGVEIPAAWAGSVLFNSIEWYRTRKRMEAARRVAEAKIREQAALIEKAHDAILVQGLDGRNLYANPSAERLYGWSGEELQRNGEVVEIFSPDAELAAAARAAVLQSGEWNGELRQQTRDGRRVIVASRWTLIRDDAGRPTALLMMSTDITERKQLEAQFLRTQRLNTIGALAGGMAHDLNNALAPILMGVQLLRRKSSDHEARDLLQLMEASTHRGADMVRQVLLFARGRGGEFERLELGPLFQELEKMIRETFPKEITVDSFLPGDLWPVRGNPTQLHQILLNLCVNARDAMPKGGKLSFVADNVELRAEEAAAIPNGRAGRFVSVLVSDTGIGMPPEVRAKIFEPFFTTKDEGKGTGIGLATVWRLVQAHEGFLRVESEPGEGTTFEIFLPRSAEVAPAAPKVAADLVRGNGETILIADDEQAIRELLTAELTSAGYRVLSATNGAEAIALFRERGAEIRLFITDGAMPILSGRDAIATLRKNHPDLPIILISGDAEANQAANITVVSKPFSLEDILASIQQILAG